MRTECQRFSCRLGICHARAAPGLAGIKPKLQTCEAALAASLCWLVGCYSLSASRAGQGSSYSSPLLSSQCSKSWLSQASGLLEA